MSQFVSGENANQGLSEAEGSMVGGGRAKAVHMQRQVRIRVLLDTSNYRQRYPNQEHFREELEWVLAQTVHPHLLGRVGNSFILFDQLEWVDCPEGDGANTFFNASVARGRGRHIAGLCLMHLLDPMTEQGRCLRAHMRTDKADVDDMKDYNNAYDIVVRMTDLLSNEEWQHSVRHMSTWAWGLHPRLGSESLVSRLNGDIARQILRYAQYDP